MGMMVFVAGVTILAGALQFSFFRDRACPHTVKWFLPGSILVFMMGTFLLVRGTDGAYMLLFSAYVLAGTALGGILGRLTRR